ncbi:DUF6197 family protein [Modestobacter altitudinis]|uniref:DUF6197 family protein n=1 Tax=Modestobacter altitudinis TaxID=2213158 RepID=UPI00110CB2FD|nr:hypothetical protein [Modestobacter altitudinis]
MTVIVPAPPLHPGTDGALPAARPGPPGRRGARQRRRAAARAGRAAARRAELHGIREVLVEARAVLGRGWVQGTWTTAPPLAAVAGPGPERAGAQAAVCLVGAVVLAAGGRAAVRGQRAQRSLDLLWHTLHRATDPGPVRWCPAPALRTLQVQDLTRWNDTSGRSLEEVRALLDAAIGRVTRELQVSDAR